MIIGTPLKPAKTIGLPDFFSTTSLKFYIKDSHESVHHGPEEQRAPLPQDLYDLITSLIYIPRGKIYIGLCHSDTKRASNLRLKGICIDI